MRRGGKNQKGQALLEYAILLFISILMILGLVYQFNDAFRQYLSAWVVGENSYLFCLIQNGALPGESDLCTLPTFNLNSGKMLSQNGLGGTPSAGEKINAGKIAGGGGGVGNIAGGGPGTIGTMNEGAGPAGGFIPATNLGGGNGKNAAGGAGGKNGKGGINTGDLGFRGTGGGFFDNGSDSSDSSSHRGSRLVPIKGAEKLGGPKAQEEIPVTEKDMRPPRLVAAEKARARLKRGQDLDSDFSFQKILKYIVIIAMSFAILFFIGSQLFAIAKGRQKRQ